MPKKKVKPNAFWEFTKEYMKKEGQCGRRYAKEDWASIASPLFNNLSAAEKEHYKELAKTKPSITVEVTKKFNKSCKNKPKLTAQGIPLEQVEQEERERVAKRHFMLQKVKNIVENAFLDNDIAKKPFVFIMANYFYKNSRSDYSPAELAVAKFNFEDGIYNTYHTFINPETVALCYAFEAKDRSEKVHRLPPPPLAMGEKNYDIIYTAMLDVIGARPGENFAKNDERRPCVFIRKQDTEMIESILDQLSDKQWEQTFDVFELELLFNRLKNKANDNEDPLPITVTNEFIERDRYEMAENIACNFHENEHVTQHCALSYLRRWFYLFTDHVCDKIGVKLIPGKHLPSDVLVDATEPFDPFNEDTRQNRPKDHHSAFTSNYKGYSDSSSEDD